MYFKVILLFSKPLYLTYMVTLGGLWNILQPRPQGLSPTTTLKWGRGWNILYENELFSTLNASLSCKNWQLYFYVKTLIMRYRVTIWGGGGNSCRSDVFPDRVLVLSIKRNPIEVLLIRSDPVRSDPIRSDPVRSLFC